MKVIDLIKEQDELVTFEYKKCFLHPSKWNTVVDLNLLNWTSVSFNTANQSLIPFNPGIYSFIITPEIANIPHAYLGYIGKTERTLNERYAEYLREKNNLRGRPKLLRLLNKWDGYLKFAYVELNIDVELIESRLNDAFLPPYNDKYTLKINKIINAF